MNAMLDLTPLFDRLAGPAGLKLSLALLHFLWQGVLIAAAAALLMRLAGRRSANRRYAIGVAGLTLMTVAPVVTFCLVTPPASPPRLDLTDLPQDDLRLEIERLDALLAAMDGGWVEQGEAHQGGLHAPGGTETPKVGLAPLDPPYELTWPERLRLWQPYALLLWLAGTAVFALRLGVGVRASWMFGRGRRSLPDAWLATVAEVAGRLGVKTPRVFLSDRVAEAVAVGLLRPMVLLPAAWLGRVPPEVFEAVLAHELAHLRRYDLWVNLLQRCVEAALFYHPAVWWLSRRVRVEREYCCDETAALAVSGRAAYARALEFVAAERVAATRPTAFGTALAAGMGGDKMALLDRVRRVLKADGKPSRGNWIGESLLALAVPAALWAGIAAVGPAIAQADEEDAKAKQSDDKPDDRIGDVEFWQAQGVEPGDITVLRIGELVDLATGEARPESRFGVIWESDLSDEQDVLTKRPVPHQDATDLHDALRELREEMKALRREVEELRSSKAAGGSSTRADREPAHHTGGKPPVPPAAERPPSETSADVEALLEDYRRAVQVRNEAARLAASEAAVGLAHSHKRLVEAQRRLDRLRAEVERRAPGVVGESSPRAGAAAEEAPAEGPLTVAVYPAADLIASGPQVTKPVTGMLDTLVNLITGSIRPDSWEDTGGRGRIEKDERAMSLIIVQAKDVHEEIADLLQGLRALQRGTEEPGSSPSSAYGPIRPGAAPDHVGEKPPVPSAPDSSPVRDLQKELEQLRKELDERREELDERRAEQERGEQLERLREYARRVEQSFAKGHPEVAEARNRLREAEREAAIRADRKAMFDRLRERFPDLSEEELRRQIDGFLEREREAERPEVPEQLEAAREQIESLRRELKEAKQAQQAALEALRLKEAARREAERAAEEAAEPEEKADDPPKTPEAAVAPKPPGVGATASR